MCEYDQPLDSFTQCRKIVHSTNEKENVSHRRGIQVFKLSFFLQIIREIGKIAIFTYKLRLHKPC